MRFCSVSQAYLLHQGDALGLDLRDASLLEVVGQESHPEALLKHVEKRFVFLVRSNVQRFSLCQILLFRTKRHANEK